MTPIAIHLEQVRRRVQDAALAAKRNASSVTLMAVSKTFPAKDIEQAIAAGQKVFGENYVQEAIEKIQTLAAYRSELEWHFIGPLQSNKTKDVAAHFDWVHSIDRIKIAKRLSSQRGALSISKKLQLCVQVNVSNEDSKSGTPLDEAETLCNAIAQLPHLTLRGLMAIPEPTSDPMSQAKAFGAVEDCFKRIQAKYSKEAGFQEFDTLSMGMSDDMEAAIAHGSTIVRVGTAIFGKRDKISA
ncbi:YggS family pyridoxal phosphate-dependent enzyme [Polynucleobacter paneuropaeus]|jgi:pyridoxal phosphate enzyme (YggS family)|uniref:Pyridoxal phosphate homeostasis protein n=1 Tax=Polynucleobacter paneuropaeus TaxID=2527775 RepID=A0A9Q7G343_9BURK|nr:YggS family pyridoxal phosphate-dependent enzyme [Polynucleobacter paneuropaeus]AWW46717.1 YggS family pyridoxal phosphate-dependent enzyme [Polynucleobacter paneuropaeus]AWW48485.1 YggS family pyridoxal phosphate-dependent enzyme [Polynucleobacter paneuropaeus]MBT8516717.1 YggS family pyridoxal phosphate-dependent enzyme [Polynucleobacter paneuropaeus]MBT8517724.1 YggS family pyridoxal phosphate-dependent enzyme [Polynucleobacter paneuropaeus]MBT8526186.1 YggS family pyridoxal phosphate-de